jgi:hypothetical protein
MTGSTSRQSEWLERTHEGEYGRRAWYNVSDETWESNKVVLRQAVCFIVRYEMYLYTAYDALHERNPLWYGNLDPQVALRRDLLILYSFLNT